MKFLLILTFVAFAAAQTDWCNIPYCTANTHVQCLYANSTFGPACSGRNPVLQTLTPALQQIIVDRHNYHRNQVAGGNVFGYQSQQLPQAVRMAKTQWNDQLAHFASLNALQCTFAHDSCRSSSTFRWSGQNLAAQGTSYTETSPNFVISEFLMDRVTAWFNEYAFTRVSDIDLFTTLYNGNNAIGHFTALVNELQTHVGCALIHYTDGSWRWHSLTCNYAFTNMLNFPVYRSGATASQCTTGRDAAYPNLCTVNESINPNPFVEHAITLEFKEALLATEV